MNFSVLDNKVIKLDVDKNLPLSASDTKNLNLFFDQGTFNQKLDRVKNDSFLTLDNGGFDLMQQRTLSHLYAMQEKLNELKNNMDDLDLSSDLDAAVNDPYVAQVLESIDNDYELFEQNFNHFGEKSFEKESLNPVDGDQKNNDFIHGVINVSKDILQDIDALTQKENDSALVNRFDKVVKSREELYENKVNEGVTNNTPPENEKSFTFTPH